jgi:glyoxylase-like metal-dependent hydrolase (beta-lactamase superfamily II)
MLSQPHDIWPVVAQVQVPAGMLGPDSVTFEVRCFLVPRADGIVLVDVGPPGTATAIGDAIARVGGAWSDVSDIVLTHAHFDHVGGLAEVAVQASRATVWAGAAEDFQGDSNLTKTLTDGDRVRGLAVLATPGHTPGHISLLDEAGSLVLVGDAVGSAGGELTMGPAAFTADPVRARASLERIASLGLDRVIFSHGAEISDPISAIRDLLRRKPDPN